MSQWETKCLKHDVSSSQQTYCLIYIQIHAGELHDTCWPQSHTFTNTCAQNQDGSGYSFVSILNKLSLNNVKFLPCVLVYRALRLLLSPLYDPNSGQEDNLYTYMYIHTNKLVYLYEYILYVYIYALKFVL